MYQRGEQYFPLIRADNCIVPRTGSNMVGSMCILNDDTVYVYVHSLHLILACKSPPIYCNVKSRGGSLKYYKYL